MSSCMTLPGFDNPVHDTQKNFRAILQAMSRPCLPVSFPVLLPALPDNGMGEVGQGLLSVALTLCDGNTSIWLDKRLDTPEIRHHLRFHCSSPLTGNPQEAAFAFIGSPLDMPRLHEFACGEPAYPERSTTLVIDIRSCAQGATSVFNTRLEMPGMTEIPEIPGLPKMPELAGKFEELGGQGEQVQHGKEGKHGKQGKQGEQGEQGGHGRAGMAGIPVVTATIMGPGVKAMKEATEVKEAKVAKKVRKARESRAINEDGAGRDTEQNRGVSAMLSRMPDWFLHDWRTNYAMYPLGVDVLFVHTTVDSHGAHTSLLGLPRSSFIQYSA